MSRKISKLQIFRRLIQVVFFFLFSGLYALTFSQIKQIYQMIVNGNFNFLNALPQFIEVLTLIPLTIIFGRFFCGWFCAFGTFNDFIYRVSQKIFKRKLTLNPRVNSVLSQLKYVILIFIVYFSWTKGSNLFTGASPWDAFAQLPQFTEVLTQYKIGFLILVFIIIGAALIERFFCRFLCPLGAIYSIVSALRIFSINKPTEKCGNCRICTQNCPMGIELYKFDQVTTGECINCLRCTSVCPRKNPQARIINQNINPVLSAIIVITAFIGLYSLSNKISISLKDNNTSANAVRSNAPISTKSDLPNNTSSGNNTDTIQYKDGTYNGVGNGHRSGLNVSVTIKNHRITNIEILSNRETPRYTQTAFKAVPQEIIQTQSTQVDVVSGATHSSDGIIQAVQNALSKAKVS